MNRFSFVVFMVSVLSGPHSGKCDLDWKVVGDALITEANHIPNPEPADFVPTNSIVKIVKVGEKNTYDGFGDSEAGNDPAVEETTTERIQNAWGDVSNEESVTGNPVVPAMTTNDAETHSYPWLASIQKDKKQICTGTLIDSGHVLTTAYCLYYLTAEDLAKVEIDIGYHAVSISKFRQYELTQGPYMTLKVKRSIRHLRFSPATAYNDIALLQLITPIVANEAVQPISLLNNTAVERDDQSQRIIGWRDGQDLNGESLQYWRDQPSIGSTLEECRKSYSDILDAQGVSPGMICSGGYTDATSCRWKFGTPLILGSNDVPTGQGSKGAEKITQVGIYSWSSEALLPKCVFSPETPKPMVFTRVSSYYDWIQRNLRH